MTQKTQTVERNGFKFTFVNREEFELLYDFLFNVKEYVFKTDNKKPYILDCGAHIGGSILFFKKYYPEAHIVGFEPNPHTFELLKTNIEQNNLKNVSIINAALSDKDEHIDFHISAEFTSSSFSWSWGDSGVKNTWFDEKNYKKIKVQAKKLSGYIDRTIDLIKLDIEGMEETVLKEIEPKLHLVKEIHMEFHGSSTNPDNDAYRILNLLKRNGFDYIVMQQKKEITEDKIQKTDPYWLIIRARNKKLV